MIFCFMLCYVMLCYVMTLKFILDSSLEILASYFKLQLSCHVAKIHIYGVLGCLLVWDA